MLTNQKTTSLILIVLFAIITISGCVSADKPTNPTEAATFPALNIEDNPTPTELAATSVNQATSTATLEANSTMNTGNADVKYVKAIQSANGTWTFHVTVLHPDSGWEDYANGWDVVTLDGVVLKSNPSSPFTRLLVHPHVDEQPFTRSQSGIVIPDGVTVVIVRANDLVDGFGGEEVTVDLTQSSGENFEVQTSN